MRLAGFTMLYRNKAHVHTHTHTFFSFLFFSTLNKRNEKGKSEMKCMRRRQGTYTHTLHNIASSPPVKREANNNNNRIVEALSLHSFHSLLRHPHLPPRSFCRAQPHHDHDQKKASAIHHQSSYRVKTNEIEERGRRLYVNEPSRAPTIEANPNILNFVISTESQK